MSNAKRAIMVPVMTLAVCAIAMVGLGFALTTSVTSNSNDVEKLMIDLDSDQSGLGTAPDTTNVDKLFTMKVKSDKNANVTHYKLENDYTYVKVFSNVAETKATLDVTAITDSDIGEASGNIASFEITLYQLGSDSESNTTYTSLGSATVSSIGGKNPFGGGTAVQISTGVIYALKITKVVVENGETDLEYTETSEVTIEPGNHKLNLSFTATKVTQAS